MKLPWNSLLITLGILLSNSIVLATETTNPSESQLLILQTEEIVAEKENVFFREKERETYTETTPTVLELDLTRIDEIEPTEINEETTSDIDKTDTKTEEIVEEELEPSIAQSTSAETDEVKSTKIEEEAISDVDNTNTENEEIVEEELEPSIAQSTSAETDEVKSTKIEEEAISDVDNTNTENEEVVEEEAETSTAESTSSAQTDEVKSTTVEEEAISDVDNTDTENEEVVEEEAETSTAESTSSAQTDEVKSTTVEEEAISDVDNTNTENKEIVEEEAISDVDNTDTENKEVVEEEAETSTAESISENNEPETQATELSEEELAREQKLIEADELYLSGNLVEAEKLYREVKELFAAEVETEAAKLPEAIYDSAELSPKGAVYWRISSEGVEQQLESKIFIPLEFLVEQHPEFIPGHLRYAQALKDYERPKEALQVLERAAIQYSNEPDLLRVTIETYGEEKQWLEASLMARQFALLNPEHPEAEEFIQLADYNLERYQKHLRAELRGNLIANILTGALGYAFTGSLFGPLSALETTALLLQGESAIGNQISNQVQEQAPMLEDEEVVAYVREIGNKLVAVTGRDQFDYEFYVIMDDQLNAFALPGGKIFINAGALTEINSEAELAGLLAHELSHSVLSHGFQLVTQGNLTSNLAQFIPFGGTAANLIVLNYSRGMERQADIFGTRILAASGYAADGLRNLTVTLKEQDKPSPPAWLSSHPNLADRVEYLETLIVNNGYNRYAYEGVERHSQIKKKVEKLMEEYKESEDYRLRKEGRRFSEW